MRTDEKTLVEYTARKIYLSTYDKVSKDDDLLTKLFEAYNGS